MKFRGILAIIFSLSLALFAGNALAGGKSNKSYKNDIQSSRHSEKSAKSAKSEKSSKNGNGFGHCKSDKSGKGHSKKNGKGHDRDDDCDNNGSGGEPPVLVCLANVERHDETIISDADPYAVSTTSVNFVGKVCDIEGSTLSPYTDPVSIPSENRMCFASSEIIGEYTTSETEFWYPIDILLECEVDLPS